jgi:hypothetical protein
VYLWQGKLIISISNNPVLKKFGVGSVLHTFRSSPNLLFEFDGEQEPEQVERDILTTYRQIRGCLFSYF